MKIRSRAYIQLGEETLKTVHRTFQPGVPVHLHLPALTDGSLTSKSTSTPTMFVIQEGLNCLEMTDYFFTNIEPTPIVVEHPAAHQNKSTSQQPVNGDTVSQQTHPQQPEETRIHPSMLINRQVPVLNLTKTKITSHADLQDAFNSLCVCSHDNPHEPPQIESEGCDISHNALYSHQIDIAKESEDFEKLFYIYQHFQDSEKIHQIGIDSDVLTTQEDSLYPYVNNDIEYGLFEDIVESYHLDSQIKDDFQCNPDCYTQTNKLTKDDYLNICTLDY